MEFYQCEICGKIVAMVKDGVPDTLCCGEPMVRLVPNASDGAGEKHVPVVKVDGNVVTVEVGSLEHPMEEAHHIEWIAIETTLGNQRKELDPQGKPKASFALLPGEKVKTVYEHCNLHGLWKLDMA
jgi:superoxide reductase